MYSYYSELSKFEMYEIKEVFNVVIYFSGALKYCVDKHLMFMQINNILNFWTGFFFLKNLKKDECIK